MTVASNNLIWSLTMVPVSEQVPQLLRDKQFELACTLGKVYRVQGVTLIPQAVHYRVS